MTTTMDALQQMLGEMRTNSAMALNILDVCQRPDSSAADLAQAIEADPALSLRIMRLANSPTYRGRREVESVHDAVARVGRSTTQSMAVTAALDADDGESCPPEFWDRAMTTAATTMICAELRGTRLPEAFPTGLLVDIGCHLLYRLAPEAYGSALDAAGAQHHILVQREEELVQLTHCQAGALALSELGLPSAMCEAIRVHHQLAEPSGSDLEVVVAAGAELAIVLDADDMAEGAPAWLVEALGQEPEHLRCRIEDEVEGLRQAAFGLR